MSSRVRSGCVDHPRRVVETQMVVWIASYPRSGNTLFRMLLRYGFGASTFSVFDDPLFFADSAAGVIGHESLPDSPDELAERAELFFIKTHRIPDAGTPHPAIYIVRDGRDSLVSCAHYQMTYGGTSLGRSILRRSAARLQRVAFRRALRKMVFDRRFGGWSMNVTAWHERDARTAVVRFEDLVRDPVGKAAAALAELGVSLEETNEEMPSFESLQTRWPGFFRRGRTGSWRDEMPDDIQGVSWQRHGSAMRMLGYR